MLGEDFGKAERRSRGYSRRPRRGPARICASVVSSVGRMGLCPARVWNPTGEYAGRPRWSTTPSGLERTLSATSSRSAHVGCEACARVSVSSICPWCAVCVCLHADQKESPVRSNHTHTRARAHTHTHMLFFRHGSIEAGRNPVSCRRSSTAFW